MLYNVVSFCCTTWISYIYSYIPSFLSFSPTTLILPLLVVTEHWSELHMLYRSFPLAFPFSSDSRFIRIPTTGSISYLYIAKQYFIVYRYHHLLAIVNSAATTLGVHVFFCYFFFQLWFSQGICSLVGLLGHKLILFVAF